MIHSFGSETHPELRHAIIRTTLPAVEKGGFDVVVVGAGASGGLAAELFCQAGLKVLVLDAGWQEPFWSRPVDRTVCSAIQFVSRPSATRFLPPRVLWKAQQALRHAGRWRRPVQSACYAWPTAPSGFVDDIDNPYEAPSDQPYRWIRARQIGGRMVVPAHGKQYYRHSDADFAPNDGLSPKWPVSSTEMAPWYADVERRIGMHGRSEGVVCIPDSEIAHPIEPNDTQAKILELVAANWPGAPVMLGRYAAPPQSLATAAATGKLHCRRGAIAAAVKVAPDRRVEGLSFYDRQSSKIIEVKAPLVFLCASSFESVRILLNSRTSNAPEGLGGASGHLGRHIMDHVSVKLEGTIKGAAFGRSRLAPEDCVFLPRFDTRPSHAIETGRGYGVRLYVYPGPNGLSYFTAVSDSEMLPRAANAITLSNTKDRWGIPAIRISCSHGASEIETSERQIAAVKEIADAFGVVASKNPIERSTPGASIHEVGGARMGDDPATSVLDPYNQCWDVKGLFVTDGAAFPSIGIQNPTLTILALTARACSHALGAG